MTQPLEHSSRLAEEVDMVAEPARLRPDLPRADPQEHRGKKLSVIHGTSCPEAATVGRDGTFPDLGWSLRGAC